MHIKPFLSITFIRFMLPAICLLLLNTYIVQSNTTEDRKDITEEIEVVKPFQPRIEDFKKKPAQPDEATDLPDTDFPEIELSRSLIAAKHLTPERPPMEAAPVRKPVLEHLDNHYFRAAGGNYRNLMGEYFYNSTRSRDLMYNAHVKHNSGWGPLEHSITGETLIHLNGQTILSESVLKANLYGNHSVYHYYGRERGDEVDDATEIRQYYNRAGFSLQWSSLNNHLRSFEYSLEPFYNYFDSRGGMFNHHAGTHFYSDLNMDWIRLNLDGSFHWDDYGMAEEAERDSAYRSNLFQTSAAGIFDREDVELKLGAVIAVNTTYERSKLHVYPDVYLQYDLAGDFLQMFGGITGGMRHHNHATLTLENPYLLADFIDLRNTNEKFEVFAGTKGTISDRTGFEIQISYKNLEDLPFYQWHSFTNQFEAIYDEGTTTLLNLRGNILYELREDLMVNLEGSYKQYDLSGLEHPYNRPSLKGSLTGRYSLLDDWTISLGAHAMDERYISVDTEDETTEGFIDINAGAEYEISGHFSAFLQTNNLLNNNYHIWSGYPVRGFHMLLGGSIRF